MSNSDLDSPVHLFERMTTPHLLDYRAALLLDKQCLPAKQIRDAFIDGRVAAIDMVLMERGVRP